MLALNHQMHHWWGKGLWALKCLEVRSDGEEESSVRLQFHWMPSARRMENEYQPWLQRIDLPSEGRKMVEDWKMRKAQLDNPETSTDITTAAINVLTCRPLRSGHTFEIFMEKADARKMKAMVDIQWACIQLASMSGAAGCPEFLIDSDDEDEADFGWVEISSA
ncbi:hypothetical protein B0T17DRAFT_88453 [Bombardia bombarda]|uniref:Uncharacterized protein n=1 Tax=Bombardia bombarda TaxID=252184 RepID=A0AA39XMF0_9PEZI|nr:hypothetical protein B0T17DRAFT_88453 [Bombardia bombarda]